MLKNSTHPLSGHSGWQVPSARISKSHTYSHICVKGNVCTLNYGVTQKKESAALANIHLTCNILHHRECMFSEDRSSNHETEHFHWLEEVAMWPKIKSMQQLWGNGLPIGNKLYGKYSNILIIVFLFNIALNIAAMRILAPWALLSF